MPVCWTRRDGGWAAEVWATWLRVRDIDSLDGRWKVDWKAFDSIVSRRIRDDDEARLELVDGLAICASVQNSPKEGLFPDSPDED